MPSPIPISRFSIPAGAGSLGCFLRSMIEADLEQVCRIERQAHSHPWNRGHFENCLATGNLAIVAVAQTPPQPVLGYALVSLGGGEGEIINLAVAPEHQRRGLAKHLLHCVLDQARARVDTLFLEVRESNAAAIALYDRFEFNQVGVRPNYYPARNGREDALILARVLEPQR